MEENEIIRVVSTKGKNAIPIGAKKQLIYLKVGEKDTIREQYGRKVKWVGIAVEYIKEVKELLGEVVSDKWSSWGTKRTEKILKYGIGKQYGLGTSIKTRIMTVDDMLEGTIYYYEPFLDEPNFEVGRYIAAIGEKPKIVSAYFARYREDVFYPDGSNNMVFTYKSSITLFINTHLLPDYTVSYHNFALFEITICDTDGNIVTDPPLKYYQRKNPRIFAVNTLTEINIEINETWKIKSRHKDTKDKPKTFYAKIKTIIYKNDSTFTGKEVEQIVKEEENSRKIISPNDNPGSAWTNKFSAVAPNHDAIGVIYTDEDEAVSNQSCLGRIEKYGMQNAIQYTREEIEEIYDTSNAIVFEGQGTFQVKYDDMDVIIENYEKKKNNMFVVVGDREYNKMSNEPCKFSKITINHPSRETPFVLFNEHNRYETVKDKTDSVFGIVAGSNTEKITITAHGLQIEEKYTTQNKPRCLGITTSTFKGNYKKVEHVNDDFKHKTIEDVFMMKHAYRLDIKKRQKGNQVVDITGQNIDYQHKDNYVDLNLKYYYDKTISPNVKKYIGEKANEWVASLLNDFWVLNYFLLNDSQAQRYFVPISTCRYPNQKAIIKVYPNISWALTLSFGKEGAKYEENWTKKLDEEKLELVEALKEDVNTVGKAVLLGKKEAKLKTPTLKDKKKKDKEEKLKKINVSLSVGALVDGESVNFTPQLGQKVKDYAYNFAVALDLIKKITGNSYSKKKQDNLFQARLNQIAEKRGKKILKKLAKFPVTITVHNPSFSVGFAWSRTMPKYSEKISDAVLTYDIQLKASPLFKLEGSMDLITCASLIPTAGQVIKVAEIVLNVAGVEPVLKLSGEGSIETDIKGTMESNGKNFIDNLQKTASASLKFIIEASITANGGLAGFLFAGGDFKGFVTDTTYKAYAETGFDASFGSGANNKGPYITANVHFIGLVAVGKKETKMKKMVGKSKELFRYTIIEETYFIENAVMYF